MSSGGGESTSWWQGAHEHAREWFYEQVEKQASRIHRLDVRPTVGVRKYGELNNRQKARADARRASAWDEEV